MTQCPWVIPDPLCCDCWNTADPAMKAQAIAWASAVMYARTGRQFGLCPITVRPCMERRCSDGIVYGAWWSGSLWTPYILNGIWFNCFCGEICSCKPRCEVRLAGPVAEVVEVTIGGVVVDPATYRVDDYQWLVRQDGECWPECANMDNASGGTGVWEVTYTRGREVPQVVLNAAAILACEYVKMCKKDASCRISSRVVAMDRQGTSFQFVAPDDMIKLGLTGIGEVDDIIIAFNPAGLRFQPRVFSSAVKFPRQQTWP